MDLKKVDWNDLRIKGWQLALVLGAAYAGANPKYGWAVPALTAAAGLSQSPVKST